MKQRQIFRAMMGSALALAQGLLLMGPAPAQAYNTGTLPTLGSNPIARPSAAMRVSAPITPAANQANLQITAHAASTNISVPGGIIQYNITITNAGPQAAQAVQVIFSLTSSNLYGYVTLSGGTAPAGWSCVTAMDGHSRTCSRSADMPSGTTEALTFTLTPNYVGLLQGVFFQFATSASSEDPDTSNNLDTPEDVTVTSSLTQADMSAEVSGVVLQDGSTPASIPGGSLSLVYFGGRNNGSGTTPYSTSLNLVGGALAMGQYHYEFACANSATTVSCQHPNLVVPEAGSGILGVPPVYAFVLAPTTGGTYNHLVSVDGDLSDPLATNDTKTTSMVVTTPDQNAAADVEVVSAQTGPSLVNPGATVFYTISVRNNGPATANKVLLWVPNFQREIPGLGTLNNNGAGPLTPNGWSCHTYAYLKGWYCATPSMKNGESATLYFRFSAPLAPGKYYDYPAIGSESGDFNTQNNMGIALMEVGQSATPQADVNVKLTHTSGQTPLPSGDPMKLRFRVSNLGPDKATHAYVGVFWDIFNAAWSLDSYSAPSGWSCTQIPGYDGGMDCFKPSMNAGEDEEWTVILQAPNASTITDMSACVLANNERRNEAYEVEPYGGRFKFACDTYYVTPFKANISITGRDNPDPVNAGGPLTYTLVVHNDGPDDLVNGYYRQLLLDVPADVAFLRMEGPSGWATIYSLSTPGFPSEWQFYFPVLAAGETTTATVTVLAPSITGTLAATATVRASDFDVDLSNNEIVFDTRVSLGEDAADLAVTLDAPTNLCLNASGTVTATVTNYGPDVALSTRVNVTVPTGLAITAITSSDFVCSVDSATTGGCDSNGMNAGASSAIVVSVRGVTAGSGNVQASISSRTPDGNQGDNLATSSIAVSACGAGGRIAYLFNGERDDALAYESLLEGRGYTVTLIGLNAITRTNLSIYDLFILADDSGRYPGDGEWFTWGTDAASTAAQMAPIMAANKPVIGLGEGGSVYLEKRGLSIGWLSAWYRTGDDDTARPTPLTAGAVYAFPNAIPADPVKIYSSNDSALNVYGPRFSGAAFPIGAEIPDGQHFNVAGERCHFSWGFRNSPTDMTSDGKNLFHNLVEYAIRFQCPPPQPPPPQNCVAISKSSDPPNGARVPVSDASTRRISLITYTLSYTVSNATRCGNTAARLVDVIPPGTDYVLDSASDGISPDSSGALVWELLAGGSGSKQFTVVLLDSACNLGETVHNRARITMAGRDPIDSNEVKHEPVCPPVTGVNVSPPFAQDELTIYPYPIIAGQRHTVSVRLTNHTLTNTTVTVRLMNSANAFGIGIPFSTYATRTVSIPSNGNVIVQVPAVFARTGHYCICVEIDIPGYGTIRSCRNLDVMEDLRPGVPDTITFAVGNPLNVTTDIRLDVDNTCAGFTAVVAPLLLPNMAPGEVRSASLVTTPPSPVVLGSGCHIDVRGYYRQGSRWMPLNEGIRKLDVPPIQVSNPPGVAPWLSPLITFREEPLRAGVPNSICIELHNPLPITKVVTLTYQVANFGAGIGFSTVPGGIITVTLPPNSRDRYCISWTPPAAGHYCVLVIVGYPGYRPTQVQRNVDVYRNWRPDLTIPVLVHNPDLISHTLRFRTTMWGIDPNLYEPVFQIPRPGGGGDPAPDVIGAGQQLQLQVAFRLRAFGQTASLRGPQRVAASNPLFGDVQRVDVAVEMDGKDVIGFSVVFEKGLIFLPLISKP